MMNQKGMEMPIQIFITLFVLLAVAMLVLQLVNTQFSQQQERLDTLLQNEERDAKSMCEQKISSCSSLRERADFCATRFLGKGSVEPGLDYSGDGFKNGYYEKAGVGGCEDTVYCSQLVENACQNQPLTMRNCVQVLCQYWRTIGIAEDQLDAKLNKAVAPGGCYADLTDAQKQNHWYGLLAGESGTLHC